MMMWIGTKTPTIKIYYARETYSGKRNIKHFQYQTIFVVNIFRYEMKSVC